MVSRDFDTRQRDLDCMRHCFPDGFGIGAGAVSADNLCTGVRAQSGGYGLALPVGQKIDHPVRLKVAQYGAVAMSLAPGPIVDAKNARSPRCHGGSGSPPQLPQQRGAMDQQPHTACQPRSRFTAQSHVIQIQCFGRTPCPRPTSQDGFGQPVGEDAPSAITPAAEELPSLQRNTDRDALPGQIAQLPNIPAMHAPRYALARRTDRRRAAGSQAHLDGALPRSEQNKFDFGRIR